MTNNYSVDEIEILSDLEAIRKPPGMYIGSTSNKGLGQILNEVIDNSVEEAIADYCSEKL